MISSVSQAATRASVQVETIVVDDSLERDADRIRVACERYGAQYLPGPRHVATKRNLGAKAARYDLLLFIDSDCAASEELIETYVKAFREFPPEIAAAVGPTTMVGEVNFRWKVLRESRRYNQPYRWPAEYREVLWGTTSNICCDRHSFFQIGGFDEDTFTVVGGEDIDLGVRFHQQGYRIRSVPGAVVYHDRSPIRSLRQVARRLVMYGEADTYLCEKYPQRTEWKLNPISTVLIASVAILTFGARRRRHPLATLPTLWLLGYTTKDAFRDAFRKRAGYEDPDGDLSTPDPQNELLILYCFLSKVVDLAFEAGVTLGALRHGRPLLMFKRFRYHRSEDFKR